MSGQLLFNEAYNITGDMNNTEYIINNIYNIYNNTINIININPININPIINQIYINDIFTIYKDELTSEQVDLMTSYFDQFK